MSVCMKSRSTLVIKSSEEQNWEACLCQAMSEKGYSSTSVEHHVQEVLKKGSKERCSRSGGSEKEDLLVEKE